MCKCNPNIRTPWCGKVGCEMPKQRQQGGEVKTELKAVLVEMFCSCGGEMKPTGRALMSYPVQYPHVCASCGNQQNYNKHYPSVGFEKLDGTLINAD